MELAPVRRRGDYAILELHCGFVSVVTDQFMLRATVLVDRICRH
jgi:hypothetical protein